MKLTRRQLKRIISETIKMPVAAHRDVRPETIDPGGNMEDQRDFLNRVHGKPASVVDHDGFLAMKGAKEVRDSEARSLANSFVRVDMAAAESAEMKLASLLNPAFNLVVDMSSFNEYVTQRKPDPQGRPILVSMGSDGQKVVFKYRDQPKYYVYEMLPAARFDPDGSMGMKESRLRKIMNQEVRNLIHENMNAAMAGYGAADSEDDEVAMLAMTQAQGSKSSGHEASSHPYGYSLEDAKMYAKSEGNVVHWIKGSKGAEKIYVIHKDGEGMSGLNNMSDIPSGATTLYNRMS